MVPFVSRQSGPMLVSSGFPIGCPTMIPCGRIVSVVLISALLLAYGCLRRRKSRNPPPIVVSPACLGNTGLRHIMLGVVSLFRLTSLVAR